MALLGKLSTRLTNLLNGDAIGGPMGPFEGSDLNLGDRLNEHQKLLSVDVTVENGNTTGTYDVDTDIQAAGFAAGDFDGARVLVTPAGDPGSATWWHGAVALGTLTVTVSGDPGTDADFTCLIDAREL